MEIFCERCLNHTVVEGSCRNCGWTDSSAHPINLTEAVLLTKKIVNETVNSRLARTDAQEKAIIYLERSLAKINLRLLMIKMQDGFKAVIDTNTDKFYVIIDQEGNTFIDQIKVNPRMVDEVKKALAMEVAKPEEVKTEGMPTTIQMEVKKSFKKKVVESKITEADEAPKANINPDSQLITDDEVPNDFLNTDIQDKNDDEEVMGFTKAQKAAQFYARDYAVHIKQQLELRYNELVKMNKLDPKHIDLDDWLYEVNKVSEEL